MSYQITDAQRMKLIFAIDKAEGHGSLSYMVDGKPSCVIAQLAIMEGVSEELIKRWDDSIYVVFKKSSTPETLKAYPVELLQYLQFIWDDKSLNHTKAREMMRELVEVAADRLDLLDKKAQKMGLPTIVGLE